MTVPERWPVGMSPAGGDEDSPVVAAIAAARDRLGCAAAESLLMPQTLDACVLLAEDDPDNRRWLVLILERAGVRVTAVEDGQAAVEQATAAWQRGEPFDLIVMDILMPVLDGLEATRRLRAAGYAHPIVALTALRHAGATARGVWPPGATSTPQSRFTAPPW